MRAQVLVFLLVGFVVGFAGVYTWEKQRAPAIVRATPVPVDPNVPTDLSAGNSASEPSPPPLNLERVKELTSKIKQDPKDFDSIVELGNIDFEQKNYDDAINLFKKALEIHPDSLGVRTDMGTAMLFLKRFDEAIATFQGSPRTGIDRGRRNRAARLRMRWSSSLQAQTGHRRVSGDNRASGSNRPRRE